MPSSKARVCSNTGPWHQAPQVKTSRSPNRRRSGRTIGERYSARSSADKQAALLFHEGDDLLGDVAAIKGVARGLEPGLAATPPSATGGGALLVGHVLQRAGEIGLAEHFAGFGRPAVGQKDRRRGRPGAMVGGVPLQALGHQRIHRKAVAGEPDRRRRDLAKAHRAVAPERGDPGVGCGRNHGAHDPLGDLAAVLAHEQLGVERLGPGAEPGDRDHLAARGVIDHDRRHPGDIDQIALQDAERDPGRAAGVDRVAARFEDRKPGGGGEVVAGRDGVAGHRDGRAVRLWCGHG